MILKFIFAANEWLKHRENLNLKRKQQRTIAQQFVRKNGVMIDLFGFQSNKEILNLIKFILRFIEILFSPTTNCDN